MDRLLSILHDCGNAVLHGIIALSIGLVLFSVLERMFRFKPANKTWPATLLDLQYALLSMLYPPFIYFIIAAIFGFLALQFKATPQDPGISPLWFAGQLCLVLFMRDCLIYLRHRIFHLRPVWAFHSIHHSSEEVDWLSAVRFHPAENSIEATGEILLFLGCQIIGFDPLVLSVAGLFIGFYNFFIHSNLRWTFGPLRYVFVSPVFHRWHHSDTAAAADKNFAAMFSFIDLALGTFYMPMHLAPDTTGLSEAEKPVHPRTLAGQLLYPFKKR
ncbi:MAG TPA: sterol desaturase family protein [Candidatus Acidoferrales bacterium]|jgi:sterol desaturase/sphingolipid hydroxylase (fatty acid hydroxylase superfamily)|nr:sterol desaturase family protein [Candidatus Acidoferrales bacterium]